MTGALMSVDVELARTAEVPPPRKSAWPRYEADEIQAVAEVLGSGQVNSLHHGKMCRRFESEMAELCEMPHAIAVTNGTAALHLALMVTGVKKEDLVITQPLSF